MQESTQAERNPRNPDPDPQPASPRIVDTALNDEAASQWSGMLSPASDPDPLCGNDAVHEARGRMRCGCLLCGQEYGGCLMWVTRRGAEFCGLCEDHQGGACPCDCHPLSTDRETTLGHCAPSDAIVEPARELPPGRWTSGAPTRLTPARPAFAYQRPRAHLDEPIVSDIVDTTLNDEAASQLHDMLLLGKPGKGGVQLRKQP